MCLCAVLDSPETQSPVWQRSACRGRQPQRDTVRGHSDPPSVAVAVRPGSVAGPGQRGTREGSWEEGRWIVHG